MAAGCSAHPDPPVDVVAVAKSLVPLILAARDEGEQIRRVPPEVAKALALAGLLQMFLPRSMRGPELAPLTVFRAIEEISKADGSVGWCAMIATAGSLALGWLPADVGRQFCGQPPIFAAPARCDHSVGPIPSMAAIVSEDTGILPAASIMPTGFFAHASSWKEASRN
jgi:hypothetical protein